MYGAMPIGQILQYWIGKLVDRRNQANRATTTTLHSSFFTTTTPRGYRAMRRSNTLAYCPQQS